MGLEVNNPVSFNDSDTNANDTILLQTKAADVGDMGRAGEAQVHWLDSSNGSGRLIKEETLLDMGMEAALVFRAQLLA